MNPAVAQTAYNRTRANELVASAPPGGGTGDGELLSRMAAGDESALGALYDRYTALVHSVALRVLGDADDAEEVVEETFWQAWRQAERYEATRGGAATWLSMMARSRALDRLRAGRRFRAEHGDPPETPAADDDRTTASPLVETEDAEVRRKVAEAVAALPPEQRQTVELAYFRGMSQSEIAEATGQPLGTVKTRARLALAKLRDALASLREDPR